MFQKVKNIGLCALLGFAILAPLGFAVPVSEEITEAYIEVVKDFLDDVRTSEKVPKGFPEKYFFEQSFSGIDPDEAWGRIRRTLLPVFDPFYRGKRPTFAVMVRRDETTQMRSEPYGVFVHKFETIVCVR